MLYVLNQITFTNIFSGYDLLINSLMLALLLCQIFVQGFFVFLLNFKWKKTTYKSENDIFYCFLMYFKRLQKHSDLLSRQQEVDASIGRLRRPVEDALGRKEKMLTQARPLEGQKVREMAELLAANWDKLNKLYQDRLRWAHDLPHQHHSVIRVAPQACVNCW